MLAIGVFVLSWQAFDNHFQHCKMEKAARQTFNFSTVGVGLILDHCPPLPWLVLQAAKQVSTMSLLRFCYWSKECTPHVILRGELLQFHANLTAHWILTALQTTKDSRLVFSFTSFLLKALNLHLGLSLAQNGDPFTYK